MNYSNTKRNMLAAAISGLAILLIMVFAEKALHLPKPLIVYLVISYIVVSAFFWFFKRASHSSVTSLIIQACLVWFFVASLVLSSVFYVDKAGWNWYRLTGVNTTLSEELYDLTEISLSEFLSQHPVFIRDTVVADGIKVDKGVYVVEQTIIVPKNIALKIEAGVTLKFKVGCSLIAYGPFTAIGNPDETIIFTADKTFYKWGVLGIVGQKDVLIEYAHFSHARQAHINGIQFFGGVSLIDSQVEVAHCSFTDMKGKDAFHIDGGTFIIHDNVFKNVFKDGIDIDGGTGDIFDNIFFNCGDEEIDLTDEENVLVENNVFLPAEDTGIAAHKVEKPQDNEKSKKRPVI